MDPEDLVITVSCTECGLTKTVTGTEELCHALMRRTRPIQDLLPDTEPEIREMFISGWCDTCYKLNTSIFTDRALSAVWERAEELGLSDEKGSQRQLRDLFRQLELSGSDRKKADELRRYVKEVWERMMEGEYDD